MRNTSILRYRVRSVYLREWDSVVCRLLATPLSAYIRAMKWLFTDNFRSVGLIV